MSTVNVFGVAFWPVLFDGSLQFTVHVCAPSGIRRIPVLLWTLFGTSAVTFGVPSRMMVQFAISTLSIGVKKNVTFSMRTLAFAGAPSSTFGGFVSMTSTKSVIDACEWFCVVLRIAVML